KIKSFFGVEYLLKNGDLNRRKLAREVFSDKNKLRILNNLIHPMVVQEIKRKVSMIKSGVVALEAVYFEKGFLRDVVDKIIWVDCPKEVLMKRINKERKYDAGVLEKVLELQKKPEKVDFVISNAGNKRDLLGKLKKIWPSLEK
ncbi:MAG TPA: dephospho-CoA kinase, partial [Candidatus Gracilibacteria bacterium]|nr:dephospho-CoA kinase [Candidatus Gracilibacteria bacterium]